MAADGWRSGLARRVSRVAHGTGRRPALQAGYGALIAAETALATAWAGRRARGPVDPGTLTVVVKTFERPAVLRRMLASVRRVFSGPVVVADDSRDPVSLDDPATTVLALPFDSGVGAGRNALLAAVATPYVLMADDDMVLLPDFDVLRLVGHLDRNPSVDLVGGRVVHLPLWRTADYSSAALYAQQGEPRARSGTVIDGLAVSYKVPNFYVARTERVRGVGYDDRLRRVDHNDFFTAAYGRLLCVVDPAMVCLHAHSYFDAHYQSFRMDTAADLALLAEKWGGTSPGLPAASGGLTDAQRAAFHHAAVQVVARDLGLVVVHEGGPSDARVGVRVAGDAAPLVSVLGTLGWQGSRGRLRHALWGGLSVTAGPDAAGAGVPATFAGVPGLAASAGEWPTSQGADAAGNPGGGIRRSPRAGWLTTEDGVLAAPLPAGPVLTLEPPGDLVWQALEGGARPADEVLDEVLAAFEAPPPEARSQLVAFLDQLAGQGLLER